MLEHALVTDATGSLLKQHPKTRSTDWDEVQDFCRRVYMPYRVRPLERKAKPDATLISRAVGRVIFSRFSYGTGIHLDNFDPEAGNILILNTLRGGLRHQAQQGDASTGAGESYVVDCSRTDYWLEGNDQHMQLNLTVPHDLMEEVAERWYGYVPDNGLWTRRVKFGGAGSRWILLLDYVTRAMAPGLPQPPKGGLDRHLEELICVELLREWAAGAGADAIRVEVTGRRRIMTPLFGGAPATRGGIHRPVPIAELRSAGTHGRHHRCPVPGARVALRRRVRGIGDAHHARRSVEHRQVAPAPAGGGRHPAHHRRHAARRRARPASRVPRARAIGLDRRRLHHPRLIRRRRSGLIPFAVASLASIATRIIMTAQLRSCVGWRLLSRCMTYARSLGALIAFEKSTEFAAMMDSGVRLDAIVSKQLLTTIFWPGRAASACTSIVSVPYSSA